MDEAEMSFRAKELEQQDWLIKTIEENLKTIKEQGRDNKVYWSLLEGARLWSVGTMPDKNVLQQLTKPWHPFPRKINLLEDHIIKWCQLLCLHLKKTHEEQKLFQESLECTDYHFCLARVLVVITIAPNSLLKIAEIKNKGIKIDLSDPNNIKIVIECDSSFKEN